MGGKNKKPFKKTKNKPSWRRVDELPEVSNRLESNPCENSNDDNTFGMLGGFVEVMDGDAYMIAKKQGDDAKIAAPSPSSSAIHTRSSALQAESSTSESLCKPPPNKKKKKRKKINIEAEVEAEVEAEAVVTTSKEDVDYIKTLANWSSAGANVLHHDLVHVLAARQYWYPTPIQAKTLASSLYGCDIVGAAPTGSGKTIAYLLPILNMILSAEPEHLVKEDVVVALIITPTRELALQVTDEAQILSPSTNVCTIVGGLAQAKQIRQLNSNPRIIIATPGRLWDLISSGAHLLFDHLSQSLRFLVIDEADRMLVHGKFAELERILEHINNHSSLNRLGDTAQSKEDDFYDSDAEENIEKLLGLEPAEAHVEMMPSDDAITEALSNVDENVGSYGDSYNKDVRRQTFIYSATLMMDPNLIKKSNIPQMKQYKKKKTNLKEIDGPISEILKKAQPQNKVKRIDLSTSDNFSNKNEAKGKSTNLPPGLSLFQVRCTQKHKDSYLYSLLVCTSIGSSGPSLVFCNSIACVKRLYGLLSKLKLSVRMLHADMAQKARLQAIESLSTSSSRSVVICTDVAARGLDIDSISTIVHYDIPRSVDTFVHRSGRTARGVGEKAVGNSVSLVSSAEERTHRDCCNAVGCKHFDDAAIDGQLLKAAQERVSLASKIVAHDWAESKINNDNAWYKKASEEAGIDLDESLLDDVMDGKCRKQQKQHTEGGKQALAKLKVLLSQPMRTQSFGKFLSGAGIRKAIRMEHAVKPHVYIEQDNRKSNKKKRRR